MAYLLNQADRQVFNTVLPQIRDSLSLTDVSVGWIATIFNLFFALMVPIGGWAGDRFSKKWVTTISILFWSVATMMTGFAGGFLSLVLLRSIATGGGEAMFAPACNSLLSQYHTETRARAFSAYEVLDRLINHEWKTSFTEKAPKDGVIRFRGFKGKYRITYKNRNGKVVQTDFKL